MLFAYGKRQNHDLGNRPAAIAFLNMRKTEISEVAASKSIGKWWIHNTYEDFDAQVLGSGVCARR
jgi:hypothetical protein